MIRQRVYCGVTVKAKPITNGLAKWRVTDAVFHRPVRCSTFVPADRISIEHFAITSTKERYQLWFAGLTVILLPPLRQAANVVTNIQNLINCCKINYWG